MSNHVAKRHFRFCLPLTSGPEREFSMYKMYRNKSQVIIFGLHSHKSRTPLIYL